ncbi:acyl-CoA thioesterase [Microvirga roseola]|uniref:acyl-CoA thioesterase n=1 Tax=Microvirga roseola TaxID=2883126 RepID=UPI001E4F9C50|nr:thioesterase family protein [Microvirga roseola]
MKALRPERQRRSEYKRIMAMTTRLRDNDAYGHMNNAVYGEYFDTAVNQTLIEARVLDLVASPAIGLVVQSFAHFFEAVTCPGRVDVGVRVAYIGRSSVSYEFAMFRDSEELAAAQGGFTHVYVNRETRRPVELPGPMRDVLTELAAPATIRV